MCTYEERKQTASSQIRFNLKAFIMRVAIKVNTEKRFAQSNKPNDYFYYRIRKDFIGVMS